VSVTAEPAVAPASPLAVIGAGVRLMLDQLDRFNNPHGLIRTRVMDICYAGWGPEVRIEPKDGTVYVVASHGLIETYTFVNGADNPDVTTSDVNAAAIKAFG